MTLLHLFDYINWSKYDAKDRAEKTEKTGRKMFYFIMMPSCEKTEKKKEKQRKEKEIMSSNRYI